jgi:hypothetical protein
MALPSEGSKVRGMSGVSASLLADPLFLVGTL